MAAGAFSTRPEARRSKATLSASGGVYSYPAGGVLVPRSTLGAGEYAEIAVYIVSRRGLHMTAGTFLIGTSA